MQGIDFSSDASMSVLTPNLSVTAPRVRTPQLNCNPVIEDISQLILSLLLSASNTVVIELVLRRLLWDFLVYVLDLGVI